VLGVEGKSLIHRLRAKITTANLGAEGQTTSDRKLIQDKVSIFFIMTNPYPGFV